MEMTEDQIRQQIPELLKQTILLSDDRKERLQKIYPELKGEKLRGVYKLLQKAIKKQHELAQKAIKENPHLLSDIKTKKKQEFLENIRKRETTLRGQEQVELEKLEDELDELFPAE